MAFLVCFIRVKRESRRNSDVIKDVYSDLSGYITKYNDIRKKYNDMSASFVLDKYMDSHDEYMKLFSEYNDIVSKIELSVSDISDGCGGLYSDKEIYDICDSYGTVYEKLVNLYVIDTKEFNQNIAKYNEYKNDNIAMVNMLYDDYIDYNGDGEYEGVN